MPWPYGRCLLVSMLLAAAKFNGLASGQHVLGPMAEACGRLHAQLEHLIDRMPLPAEGEIEHASSRSGRGPMCMAGVTHAGVRKLLHA